jgi:hypothetical protein
MAGKCECASLSDYAGQGSGICEWCEAHNLASAIGEALDDAICNGDGRPTAKHLLIELEHRGLMVVERAALQKIASGEVEEPDIETGAGVLVSMTGFEAAEIARAMLAATPVQDAEPAKAEQGAHISRPGPLMVPPDHRMKVQYPDGISRETARIHWQECINRLAGKGCKFFQLDENDQMTVALISGWFEMPRMPDMPYVDRSELVVDQVPATA